MQGIYKISNSKNGKFYIGSSKDLKYRWEQHLWMLKNNRHDNIHLQRAWNKDGSEAFSIELVEAVEDVDKLFEVEQGWLDRLDYGLVYNMNRAAQGRRGVPMSEEHKAKISAALKGRVMSEAQKKLLSEIKKARPMSDDQKKLMSDARRGQPGHKKSEEEKRKISESLKGRIMSEATKEKLRIANTGKVATEETKQKLSKANKGRKLNRVYSVEKRAAIAERTRLQWLTNPPVKKGTPRSQEVIQKMIGRKHTPEAKAKMSAARIKTAAKKRAAKALAEEQAYRQP